MTLVVSAPGLPIYSGMPQAALPLTPEDSSEPIWKSEPYTQNGKTFHLEMRFYDFDQPAQRLVMEFCVVASGTDVLVKLMTQSLGSNCQGYVAAGTSFEVYDAGFWEGSAVSFSCSADCLPWADIP